MITITFLRCGALLICNDRSLIVLRLCTASSSNVRIVSPKAGLKRSMADLSAALSGGGNRLAPRNGDDGHRVGGAHPFDETHGDRCATRHASSAGVRRLSSTSTMNRPSAGPSTAAWGAVNVSIATGLPSSVTSKSATVKLRMVCPLRSSTTTGTTTRSVEVVNGVGCCGAAALQTESPSNTAMSMLRNTGASYIVGLLASQRAGPPLSSDVVRFNRA